MLIHETLSLGFISENPDTYHYDPYLEEQEILEEGVIKQISKDVNKTAGAVLKSIKSLYKTKDSNLVEGVPELSKVITRTAVAIGAASTIATGGLAGPLVAVIALYTTHAIKNSNDTKRRGQLLTMYSTKLEYTTDRIDKEDDPKAKYQLMKVRDKLKSDINKLKVIKDKQGEDE